ncbi:MAG: MarR family winged helix-turn-helix transcriptional regulator [Burkholderiales bacterium]|jgi:DNA-binding MarR family transcriptional regulator
MPRSTVSPQAISLPPAHRAWLATVRAYNLCDAVLAERLAELGLKTGEHEVLVSLLLYPGATQQNLAAHSLTAKSVMSSLVSKLEQAGWLERRADASDARVWRLHLSTEGEALARRALAIQNAVVQGMTEGNDAAALATLEAVALRACAALEAMRSA